jgi:proline iminopeptidase
MARTGKLDFVPKIIALWEAEGLDHRTALACRDALKEITEVDHGRGLGAWKAFWEAEGKGYVKPSARPSGGSGEGEGSGEGTGTAGTAPKEAEPEKKRITTVTREMPLNFTTTGRGGAASSTIPLLVIHDDTWSPEYFDPYLQCLDDIYTIYYVELPKISALVELYKDKPDKIKKNIGGFPFYPYEALCDAFDEARKEQGHTKFAILAHGFSTIVAQRYLTKYADNVTHVIFAGALPGDDAYGNALEKLQGKAAGWKEKEIVRAVDYHYITDEKTFKRFYDPKDDNELAALERKWFTIMFANPQDSEIGRIWERSRTAANTSLKAAEREQCQSPPFDISREKKPPVPLLVISGKKSVWFGEADGERVAKNYPRGRHVVLAEAANMPWFDDPKGFQKAVRDFVQSLAK